MVAGASDSFSCRPRRGAHQVRGGWAFDSVLGCLRCCSGCSVCTLPIMGFRVIFFERRCRPRRPRGALPTREPKAEFAGQHMSSNTTVSRSARSERTSRVARLLKAPDTLGHLFESLVVCDPRFYAQSLGARVKHYRKAKGVEVDAVIERRDGHGPASRSSSVLEPSIRVQGVCSGWRHMSTRTSAASLHPLRSYRLGPAHRRPDGVLGVPIEALAA